MRVTMERSYERMEVESGGRFTQRALLDRLLKLAANIVADAKVRTKCLEKDLGHS